MKNNRILFLLHLPPPVHGSSMVGKWINESELVNGSFDCRYINLLASKSVNDTGKFTIGKILGMLMIFVKLLQELFFRQPNKVYFALTTTGFAFYRDFIFVFFIKLFRIKIIFHLHNKGIKNASKHRLNKVLYRFVFKNTKVILLSKNLYFDIEQYVKLKHIEICPNGIPDINNEEVLSLKKEVSIIPKILFLSNLIESKGVYILLEALNILKNKNTNFEAIFVGGEGDILSEDFNKKIKNLDLQNEVKYLGKKYGKEKENIYLNSDIFVFPTFYHNETFGLVLIEAMQYSLPVISCPEGGIPDIVEDGINGILVPQKNIEELANAIEKLIYDSELRTKMGNEGRLKYEKQFTLETFEKKLVSILNK